MAALKNIAIAITRILPKILKIILVVLLRKIKAINQPTKHASANEIIEITNNISIPQISAATENLNI